jgi:1-phosphatidylinositol-3-phosphate 5-kinase
MDELRLTLNDRANKAIADRNLLIANMDIAYKLSPKTDVLALNSVYQVLQEKAVAWEYV